MKDFVTKTDNTSPPTGNLTAVEFNNYINELENVVRLAGMTLDAPVDTVRQLIQAVAVGGERVSRTNGQTAQIGEIVLPDNSGAVVTINLPTADLFVNATVYFEQVVDQLYSVFGLIVGRNGNLIMGLTEDMTVDTAAFDNQRFKMVWNGTTWQVFQTESVGATL